MIRTVLGDVVPEELGTTNYHEHLFQVTPLLPGDEIDDEQASQAEAAILRASGFAAMVDATPVGLGRNPAALARISAATGLHVVASTGRHREAHYAAGHPVRQWSSADAAAAFVRDVQQGMPPSDEGATVVSAASATGAALAADAAVATGPQGPVRAGLIKAGIDYWSISRFERVTLDAVALAQRQTGTPVMVHLEFCTAAHEVLDILAEGGVPADRVVLAHADRDPDPGLHAELAARGAYLGYDGFARPRTRSDAELLELTERVVAAGCGDRIVLGGDVARRRRYLGYGGMPGLGYLGERYLPRLRERIGVDAVAAMITANPHRLLTLTD